MGGRVCDPEEVLNEKSLDVEGIEEVDVEGGVWCSDPNCTDGFNATDSRLDHRATPLVKTRVDYAAKGYSALVIALALGAARLVAVLLNETNPKWSKPTEYENLLEVRTRAASMYLHETLTPPITRGRSGYEQSRRYRETAGAVSRAATESPLDNNTCEDKANFDEAEDKITLSNETRPRLRPQGGVPTPLVTCTCPPTAPSRTTSKVLPTRSILSPATELYLILAIYTLLVLTSILGSEFVMLYTQSPVLRGGLEFSAKVLGQVLTIRGILKLTFNLFGYPWMVRRTGLLNCLRIGIVAIGSVSVLGLGWFVPWSVENENMILSVNADKEHAAQTKRPPVGMTAVLLCLSLISVGDVLGYISVLVLFGKSADRLKSGGKTMNTEGPNQQQGGSGVLWSVAQVSANVMRLTGPVLAGLLWSLTDKSPSVSASDVQRVGQSATGGASVGSTQSTFSVPHEASVEKIEFQESHGHFWAVATKIFRGSTSVFYLVGAICIVNFVASQFLYLSTPSSSTKAEGAVSPASQQHQHEPAPQAQDYFLQPEYSSGAGQSSQQQQQFQQPQQSQLEAGHVTCPIHRILHSSA
ncbi:hypothetical protein EMPS_08848 [Entomortierella parvispora]|uniref:Uncharacterized protein n=1 Tax=Entomortierella parvispora TaxID=205924 RepID=A0A9P3HGT6_9FUNG|nr:hypothetical protein EMPS_08848 [Entomortierella parvispora]